MKKEEALRILFSCASLYEKNLKNNNLLFVCVNKSMKVTMFEALFLSGNFLHLTGVKLNNLKGLSANAFYNLCLDKRLRINDFDFDTSGTTEMKLSVLPYLMTEDIGANMVGDFSSQRKSLYTEKLAGNTRGVLGFVLDSERDKYVPNTSMKEDIRTLVTKPLRVIATYRKSVNESQYYELVHTAKNIEWDKIVFPNGYEYLKKQLL